jgi:hypothetical protein
MNRMLITTLLILFGASVLYCHQAVVYVDATNGDDLLGDGKNQTNEHSGLGPIKSIRRALYLVADRGTIILLAGEYGGSNWDGGDIVISSASAPHVKSQLTLMAQKQMNNQCVDITAGSLVVDIDKLELNVETANRTEYFNLAGKLVLGSKDHSVKMNIPASSNFRLKSQGSLVLKGKSAFANAVPEMGKKK